MYLRKNPGIVSAVMALSLAGCSSLSPISPGVNDPCASLRGIIAAYPSGFEQYRGSANSFSTVTVYAAKEQIVRGHCEVWSWANNDSAYVCSGTNPNNEVATARYLTAVDWMGRCLGDGWQAQEASRIRNGGDAGVVTRFRASDANKPNVSVHKVEYRGNSSVYVYVGTPARLTEF